MIAMVEIGREKFRGVPEMTARRWAGRLRFERIVTAKVRSENDCTAARNALISMIPEGTFWRIAAMGDKSPKNASKANKQKQAQKAEKKAKAAAKSLPKK